jgi:hypothetical protein
LVCEGSVGKGSLTRDLNLREHCKAAIGFRGLITSHILDLYMYISLRLDIISEAVASNGIMQSSNIVRMNHDRIIANGLQDL